MEVRGGHILPPGSHSPPGPPPGRLQELRERQRGLRQALGLRLRELRRVCLQEAELTGQLPPEYPLEPGERPQAPPRRRTAPPPRGPLTEAARAARREVAVQLQVVEAARRLAAAPGLPPEQRRRRQRLQAEAAQRLRQLRAQLDENGSLCELPSLENGVPPPAPKPPRAGAASPDRRHLWAPDPPAGGPSRRNSLASPASNPLGRVAMETAPAHPYWPRSLSLPGYVSSARPGWQCAGAVAAAFAGLLALGWALGGAGGGARGGARRSPAQRLAAAWFLLCAAVHGGLEGYFSIRHRHLAADTGLLADIWKEYAKADSRYMTSDDFTVVMETVTAWAWGPLSFLTFLALLRDHPSRYILQLIVSLGQLYGDVLYFGTEWRAGWAHSDPHPLYFWGYFVAINALWLLLPGVLLLQAGLRLAAAQTALDRPPHKAH